MGDFCGHCGQERPWHRHGICKKCFDERNGDPAFPHMMVVGHKDYAAGLTVRDWFAGQALIGLMAIPGALGVNRLTVVESAYATADLMLAERDRK